jgi:hypothetical protein
MLVCIGLYYYEHIYSTSRAAVCAWNIAWLLILSESYLWTSVSFDCCISGGVLFCLAQSTEMIWNRS